MKLQFICPHCDRIFDNVDLEMHGRRARCACGEIVTIKVSAKTFARPSSNTTSSGILEASTGRVPNYTDVARDFASDIASDPFADAPDSDAVVERSDIQSENQADDDEQAEEHYEDLEQILAAAYVADVARVETEQGDGRIKFAWLLSRRSTSADQADGSDSENEDAKAVSRRAKVHYISGLLSAIIGFGLSSVILLFSVWNTELFPLAVISRVFAALFSGDAGGADAGGGLSEISASLRYGLMTIGWLIGAMAILMAGLALAQFSNAISCYRRHRRLVPWVDGLVATGSVVMLFLLIAAVFVHSSQIVKQKRQLNRFDSATAIANQQSDLPNVQRLRERYESLSLGFNGVMLACGLMALATFGTAMTRKLTAPRNYAADDL